MPADKQKKANKSSFGSALRRFAAPRIMSGAGPRRDAKLLEAERKALGLPKKKKK